MLARWTLALLPLLIVLCFFIVSDDGFKNIRTASGFSRRSLQQTPAPSDAAATPPPPAAGAAQAASPPSPVPHPANSSSSNPLADMPYRLDQMLDLDMLLAAHRNWQISVLERKSKGLPTMRCQTGMGHGLGNRVPGVITAFALAIMTGRIFLLESTLHEHMELPLPAQWNDYASMYDGVSSCDISHFTRLADPGLKFCGLPGQPFEAPVLISTCRWDYDLPMLQVNPTLKRHFDKFFPDGDVFYKLSRYLFTPKASVIDAMKPHMHFADKCIVGMHMRTRKPGTSAKVEQFASIARAVAGANPGTVFMATDARVFDEMVAALPDRTVWWSRLTYEGLSGGNTTQAGNPGSELGAIVDWMLLSKCKHIVLTPSSSLGGMAAGYAGVPAIYATHGHHKDPFFNPWFWRALSSEPCFGKAMMVHRVDTNLTQLFKESHPLWTQHNMCHYSLESQGWQAPEWFMCPQGQKCRD